MSEQNTVALRDALILTVRDVDADYHGTGPLALSGAEAALIADAILNSEWLIDLIRRERAEAWAECSKARRFGLKNNPYN